jgi:hypothetical protein
MGYPKPECIGIDSCKSFQSQYTADFSVSISRMGVQRGATSFPADMASNMPHMRNELRPRC